MDLKKGHQGRMRIARPSNQHLLQERLNHAADSDQEKFTIDTKDFPSLSELSERNKPLGKGSVNSHKTFSYSDKLKAPSQEGITQIVKTNCNIESKSRLPADQKQFSAGNESTSGNSYNNNNYRENCNVMNPKVDTTVKNYEQRNQNSSFVQQTSSSVHERHGKDGSSASKNEFSFPKPFNGNYKSPNCKKKSIPAGMEQTIIKDNSYSKKSSIGLNKGAYCDNSKHSESKEKPSNSRASISNYMNPKEASKSVVQNKMASSSNNSDISFNKKPRFCQSNSENKTVASHAQSNSYSDSRPLRVRLPSQKESRSGGKNDNKNLSFSPRNGINFTGSQNNDRDGKPEGINVDVAGVKKKKKRKSKIKRQTALQSGKLLVLTPEAHSRILNQTNNVTVHSSNTIFTNINDSEEYPELGTTSLPKHNKENSPNASGMNVKKEIQLQSEAEECDPSLQVAQNFPVSNDKLEDTSPKTERVKIVEEQPVKDEKVVHSNHPITLSLFDMLLTTKPKKKEVEKRKSHINEKLPSTATTKQVSAHSVNPLDSSRPTIKRGKEREKPKAKKPSRMKKLILMGRKLMNENREVLKEIEETFGDNGVRNNDDVDNETITSSDELKEQITSPSLSPTEYSCDVESADVTGYTSSEIMEYNSTFNLPYASKTSLEPKTEELSSESISHSDVFEKNILNSYVGDEKYANEQKHDIVENTITDDKCLPESTDLMACKNESNEDDYLIDIRWLFFNQLDMIVDVARKQGDRFISLGDFISVFEDAITDIKLLFKNSECNSPISEVEEFPVSLRGHLLNVADVINIAKMVKSDGIECAYDINIHDVVALSQSTLSLSHNSTNLSLLIDSGKITLNCSENNLAIQAKTEHQDKDCDSISPLEISPEISECNFSGEDRLNATKTLLHSRKFRSYCNHFVSKEIDDAVFSLLDDLARFQDRMHQKDPVKARIRRRLVYGIKEIKRHMKLKKLKCIIIASDIEDNKTEGGLNDTLKEILSLAEAYHIPYVFSHRRYNLGKLCRKSAPVSCVGIFNYEGSEKNFKKMLELQEESKHDYVEMTEKLSSELTNDQIKKLLVILNEPATVIYEVTREVLREILLPYLTPKEHGIGNECGGISHNTSTTPSDTGAIMPLQNDGVVTKPKFSNASIESGQSIGYTSSKPLENSQETQIYTIFTKYKLVK